MKNPYYVKRPGRLHARMRVGCTSGMVCTIELESVFLCIRFTLAVLQVREPLSCTTSPSSTWFEFIGLDCTGLDWTGLVWFGLCDNRINVLRIVVVPMLLQEQWLEDDEVEIEEEEENDIEDMAADKGLHIVR